MYNYETEKPKIFTKDDMKELFEKFNNLQSEKEKWAWIVAHQDSGITIKLDNDDTFGVFDDDEGGDYILSFDEYLGRSCGIQTLLEVLEIKAERV